MIKFSQYTDDGSYTSETCRPVNLKTVCITLKIILKLLLFR